MVELIQLLDNLIQRTSVEPGEGWKRLWLRLCISWLALTRVRRLKKDFRDVLNTMIWVIIVDVRRRVNLNFGKLLHFCHNGFNLYNLHSSHEWLNLRKFLGFRERLENQTEFQRADSTDANVFLEIAQFPVKDHDHENRPTCKH